MLKVLRRVLFWSHLVCGVVAGIVILIMCVTGVALTYQKEMQWWADTRHYRGGADRRRDARERRRTSSRLCARSMRRLRRQPSHGALKPTRRLPSLPERGRST